MGLKKADHSSRVVLITGASRGLGLELAKRFVDRGDIVFGVSRTKKNWKSAEEVIPSDHFILCRADMTDEGKVKRVIQTVLKTAGRIDILINNAGYGGKLETVSGTSLKEFQKQIQENLTSVFLISKYAIPALRKSSAPQLINVSSMAGVRSVPRLAGYSASKFGVRALTQAIAKENEDIGLKTMTICPGGMNTEMRASLFGAADAKRQQTPAFVAEIMMKVIEDEFPVGNGADVIIRHGKITGVLEMPSA